MSYTIPSYTVQPGSVYQPKSGAGFPVDFLASNVVGCWSTRQLLSTGSGNIIRGRDATTNEEDFTGSGYPAGVVTLSNGGDAFCPQLYDQSGNGNHATQTVAASQPGLVDAGSLIVDASGRPVMEFDGAGDILNGGDSAGFVWSNLLSVTCKCKSPSVGSVCAIAKYDLLAQRREFALLFQAGKLLVYLSQDGSSGNIWRSTDSVLSGSVFDDFAFSFDGGNFLKVYKNGAEISGSFTSGSLPSSIYNSVSNLYIGAYNILNYPFDGFINDVLIFNKALTQSEIAQLHNALT